MTLLMPLGLLALLGVVALIIIYIIKPNFQKRFVSTTFVWKLSLRYKRKSIPISKLRNVLLFLCQVLVLTICAMIITRPATITKVITDKSEIIAVVDTSASMRTLDNSGLTRFERAIENVRDKGQETFDKGGVISVMLAGTKSTYLIQRYSKDNEMEFGVILNETLEENSICTYGTADVDQAINECADILEDNPRAKIYLYRDTQF